MRVFNTLVPVVIVAGILSSTVGQGYVQSQDGQLGGVGKPRSIYGLLDFQTSSVRPEDIENYIKEQCEKYGGPTAYNIYNESFINLTNCIESLVTQLTTEINAAQSNGELAIVFKKYCTKVSSLEQCLDRYIDAGVSCKVPAEQESFHIFRNITTLFLEFICHNEGARLAMFVNGGGVECLYSQQQALYNCASQSFKSYISVLNGDPSRVTLTQISSTKDCIAVQEFHYCSVAALEKCRGPTTAIIVDDLLKLLLKNSVCENLLEEASTSAPEILTTTHIPEENLPTEKERFEGFVRSKCEKNGGPTAYEAVKEDLHFIMDCSELVVNRSQLAAEISAVDSSGNVDMIIKKYCRRAPILKECDKYATDSIKSCLEPEEQKTADIFHNMSSSWLDFICHNGGERVSTLLASHVVECFASKLEAIRTCAGQIFGSYLPRIMNSKTPFVISVKVCTDLNELRNCSINLLAECEDKTPSNLLNSAIELMYHETPCANLLAPLTTEIPTSTIAPVSLSKSEERLQGESDLNILFRSISNTFILDSESEHIERILLQMCNKNGGPMVYDAVKEIPRYLSNGIRLLRENAQYLDFEMVNASPYKLDNIFKNYCHRMPVIQEYVKRFTDSIKPCVSPEEQTELDLRYRVVRSSLEFICQNDGSRLTTVIVAGGPECFVSKELAVRNCIDEMNPSHLPVAIQGNLRRRVWALLKESQSCIVKVMKECDDPKPAYFINDLINFIKKEILPYETTIPAEITDDFS